MAVGNGFDSFGLGDLGELEVFGLVEFDGFLEGLFALGKGLFSSYLFQHQIVNITII